GADAAPPGLHRLLEIGDLARRLGRRTEELLAELLLDALEGLLDPAALLLALRGDAARGEARLLRRVAQRARAGARPRAPPAPPRRRRLAGLVLLAHRVLAVRLGVVRGRLRVAGLVAFAGRRGRVLVRARRVAVLRLLGELAADLGLLLRRLRALLL